MFFDSVTPQRATTVAFNACLPLASSIQEKIYGPTNTHGIYRNPKSILCNPVLRYPRRSLVGGFLYEGATAVGRFLR